MTQITHKDIYTKFVIEYDKANVTSSYPSLTEYEIATVLDKAYNALIAQKVTGNNYRHSMFESDVKSIADLEPLVRHNNVYMTRDDRVNNSVEGSLPSDMLYYITAYMKQDEITRLPDSTENEYNPADGYDSRSLQIKLVSHDMATKFFATPHNIPWVKDPVCYIEDKKIHVVYDPINQPKLSPIDVVYIKQPNPFVKNLGDHDYQDADYASYFDYHEGDSEEVPDTYKFECNSTMAEELVSLAVAFALENVESARLNSKLNMRGLEA